MHCICNCNIHCTLVSFAEIESEALLFFKILSDYEKDQVVAVIKKAWYAYTDRMPLAPYGHLEFGLAASFGTCHK